MARHKPKKSLVQLPVPPFMVGSPMWIDWVYATDPARDVNGRSRPTTRSYLVSGADLVPGERDTAEGQLENVAILLLAWLREIGVVKRFKVQPFSLSGQMHGVEATPDAMAETRGSRHVVIEAKPFEDLVGAEAEQQNAVRGVLQSVQIQFAIWTERWPLTRAMTTNLWTMRRAWKLNYSDAQIRSVAALVAERPMPLCEIIRDDVIQDVVLAAAYQGAVFVNPFHPICKDTYVYPTVPFELLDRIFEGWRADELVWNALPGR